MDWDWSEAVAFDACVQALELNAIRPVRAPHLIRLGTNGVFEVEIDTGVIVARVSPSDYDPPLIDEQIALASWLHANGFATSRPLKSEATWCNGRAVTFWEFIGEAHPVAIPMRLLGGTAAEFHRLTDRYSGPLPVWEPLGRLGDRLESVPCDESFSESDRALLKYWRDILTASVADMRFEQRIGPLHGDIHTGNSIMSNDQLYLIDFDRIARGPREWDLSQPLVSVRMFDVNPEGVDEFMDGYGWDVRSFEGVETLVELRALFMTSWLLTLPRNERIKEEIRNRLVFWRNPNGTFPGWCPV